MSVPSQIRISGGAGKEFGEEGKYSKPKMDMTLNLLEALKKALKLKTPVNEKTVNEVIAEVREKLAPYLKPSSSGGIKDSKVDPVCDIILDTLSEVMGQSLVDPGLRTASKCRKIQEILETLTKGLNTEFISIHVELQRVIKNMKFLSHLLKSANESIIDKFSVSDATQKAALKRQYNAALTELNRQIFMLENLLGVTSKSNFGEAMINEMVNNPDFDNLIQDLQLDPDAPIGRNLTFLLNGVNNLADVSAQVYKHMRKVGLSVAELRNIDTFAHLQESIMGKLKNKKDISTDETIEMMQALMSLKNQLHLSKDDIADYIEKHKDYLDKIAKKGGSITVEDLETSFAKDLVYEESKESGPFKGYTQMRRTSIPEQIKKHKKATVVILKALKKSFREKYAAIIAAISKISRKIGSEIPINENLDQFVRMIERFEKLQPDKENIFIALTTYQDDTYARSYRYTFLENMNEILSITEPMTKGPGSTYFREIRAAIENLLKLLDDFNTTFGNMNSGAPIDMSVKAHRSFSGGKPKKKPKKKETHESEPEPEMHSDSEASAVSEENHEPVSEEESETEGGGGPLSHRGPMFGKPETYNYGKTIKKTTRELRYFYHIADIKKNIQRMAAEHGDYTKNYQNILGECSASLIDRAVQMYNAYISQMNELGNDIAAIDRVLANPALAAADVRAKAKPFKDCKLKNSNDVKLFLKFMRDAYIGLIESAQAVDLYLSNFTKNIQEKPDLIKSIVPIVEKLELTARFFDHKKVESLKKLSTDVPAAGSVEQKLTLIERELRSLQVLSNLVHLFEIINHGNTIPMALQPGQIMENLLKFQIFDIYLSFHGGATCLPSIDECKVLYNKVINGITTKILATISAYELFNRPPNYLRIAGANETNYLPNSVIRQIMGGGGGVSEYPEIIDEAIELYVRLILLAEFYRNVFPSFEKSPGGRRPNDLIIVFFPHLNNIWGKFVKIIFYDARGINDGNYALEQFSNIIRAINDIYKFYKSKKFTCDEILMEFVVEVNKRFGMVVQSDIDNYIAEMDNRVIQKDNNDLFADETSASGFNLVDTDYLGRDILPSDRFRKTTSTENPPTNRPDMDNFSTAVEEFRKSVIKNLNFTSNFLEFEKFGIRSFISNFEKRIKAARTNEEKFRLAVNLLQGAKKYDIVDAAKMTEFHEFVLFPMTILLWVIEKLIIFVVAACDVDDVKFKADARYSKTDKAKDMCKNFIENSAPPANAQIMFIQNFMLLNSDLSNMIEVLFSESHNKKFPIINYDKLSRVCVMVFEGMKTNYTALRGNIPTELVEDMESLSEQLNHHPKIVIIEKYLIRGILRNEFGYGLERINEISKTINMQFNEFYANKIFWERDCAGKHMSLVGISSEVDDFPIFYSPILMSGNAFSNTNVKEEKTDVYYNFKNATADVVSTKAGKYIDTKIFSQANHAALKFDDAAFRLGNTYNSLGLGHGATYYNNDSSLIINLNNIIYRIINTFLDKNTKKIYKKILNPLASGYNSKDIMLGITINDSCEYRKYEPRHDTVIFASLALGIRGLVNSTQERILGKVPIHLEEDFASLTNIQKELMRAYIPGFERELNVLIRKASFLKKLIEDGKIGMADKITICSDPDTPSHPLKGYCTVPMRGEQASIEQRPGYYVQLLQSIITTAKTVEQGLLDTRRDMEDIPLYFETYSNSIADYLNRNNQYPFMPLSYVTLLDHQSIRNVLFAPESGAYPGTENFKIAYGLRGITYFRQEPSMKLMPGLENLIKSGVKYGGAVKPEELLMNTIKLYNFVIGFGESAVSRTSLFLNKPMVRGGFAGPEKITSALEIMKSSTTFVSEEEKVAEAMPENEKKNAIARKRVLSLRADLDKLETFVNELSTKIGYFDDLQKNNINALALSKITILYIEQFKSAAAIITKLAVDSAENKAGLNTFIRNLELNEEEKDSAVYLGVGKDKEPLDPVFSGPLINKNNDIINKLYAVQTKILQNRDKLIEIHDTITDMDYNPWVPDKEGEVKAYLEDEIANGTQVEKANKLLFKILSVSHQYPLPMEAANPVKVYLNTACDKFANNIKDCFGEEEIPNSYEKLISVQDSISNLLLSFLNKESDDNYDLTINEFTNKKLYIDFFEYDDIVNALRDSKPLLKKDKEAVKELFADLETEHKKKEDLRVKINALTVPDDKNICVLTSNLNELNSLNINVQESFDKFNEIRLKILEMVDISGEIVEYFNESYKKYIERRESEAVDYEKVITQNKGNSNYVYCMEILKAIKTKIQNTKPILIGMQELHKIIITEDDDDKKTTAKNNYKDLLNKIYSALHLDKDNLVNLYKELYYSCNLEPSPLGEKKEVSSPKKIDDTKKQYYNLACQDSGKVRTPDNYSYWQHRDNILFMVENDNYEEAISKFLKCVYRNVGRNFSDRDSMVKLNIIEKKIVPINFHALQREVPFINLINYDSFLKQFFRKIVTQPYNSPGDKEKRPDFEVLHEDIEYSYDTLIDSPEHLIPLLRPIPKLIAELYYDPDSLNAPISSNMKFSPTPPTHLHSIYVQVVHLWMIRRYLHMQLEWQANPIVVGADVLDDSSLSYTDYDTVDPDVGLKFEL